MPGWLQTFAANQRVTVTTNALRGLILGQGPCRPARPSPAHHPVFARFYARVGHLMDAEVAEHRGKLLAGLAGRVIEVGAGNGLNFAHYPATVSEVLAVEPEPYLRRLARTTARLVPAPIRVVDGTAEALPAEDATFDTAVASLVLCTVADLDRALAEIRRVLRPGGRLRFCEHVRAGAPALLGHPTPARPKR